MMQKPQDEIDTINNESRRKFIRGLSRLLGGSVTSVLLSGNALAVAMAHSITSASTLNSVPTVEGKIFTLNQLKQLQSICAIVIPKSDTLGAAEVNTHGFIDNQLFHCYQQAEQEKMITLLALIEDVAKQQFSQPFITLKNKQQYQLLTELDQGINNFDEQQRTDFKSLKQLICFGYYTSEVGASQELRYLAVPGGYKGSIPYKDSDASWGSQGLYY